ncbi:hypothetical protein J6590_067329 [Homalodisca vitripennis]|nr:hypothetical protein J6590_067329 [Homalodisca vitripennis]
MYVHDARPPGRCECFILTQTMARYRAFQPHSLFDLAKENVVKQFSNNGSALMSVEVPLTVRDALMEEHFNHDCFHVECILYTPLGGEHFYCSLACIIRDRALDPYFQITFERRAPNTTIRLRRHLTCGSVDYFLLSSDDILYLERTFRCIACDRTLTGTADGALLRYKSPSRRHNWLSLHEPNNAPSHGKSYREYAHTTEEQPWEDSPYIRDTLLYVVVTEVPPPLFRRMGVEWCYYAWHPPFYPQRIVGTPPSPHEPCAKPAG